MDRKLNSLFAFLLVVIFILAASTAQQWNILWGLILSSGFSLVAFLFRRLTLDGMFAAIVTGSFVFGLGGWPAAVLVLVFFISSAAISVHWHIDSSDLSNDARRNGLQVWANGFWLITCLVLAVVFNSDLFLVGAVAALATATADTWATELGSNALESTYLVTDFRNVSPGTDGGISLQGSIAAFLGSAAIAVLAIYVFSLQFYVFLCIFLAGFSGCFIDSYVGAAFQQNNRPVMLPVLQSKIHFNNNLVNGISTGAGALLAIILKLLLA